METPFWPATSDSGSPTATLVDTQRDQIEPELTQLLKSKITPAIIGQYSTQLSPRASSNSQSITEYLTDRVNDAVQYGLGQPSSSANQHSRRASNYANHERAKLIEFFTKVLRRAEVTMSVVLGALIYIDRAKPHLRIAIQGEYYLLFLLSFNPIQSPHRPPVCFFPLSSNPVSFHRMGTPPRISRCHHPREQVSQRLIA